MYEQKLKYNNLINSNVSFVEKRIKRGDLLKISFFISKKKIQTIQGLCIRCKKAKHNPSITIRFKLSKTLIEQRIPLHTPVLKEIEIVK